MIDNKKIEEAARHNADKYRNYPTLSDEDRDKVSIGSFMDCAKWMQEEFLKDLWHPASEAPRNDYTDILIVCKKPQRPIVLFLEDILDGAPDDIASYNDMWMHLCDVYKITKYCYIGDLLSKKGGENGRT